MQALLWMYKASSVSKSAEVNATKTMINRVEAQYDIKPKRLVGDTNYGNAPMLDWMVNAKGIEPHVPVWDKSDRNDGTLSRSDFEWNEAANENRYPEEQPLKSNWRPFKNVHPYHQSWSNSIPLKQAAL